MAALEVAVVWTALQDILQMALGSSNVTACVLLVNREFLAAQLAMSLCPLVLACLVGWVPLEQHPALPPAPVAAWDITVMCWERKNANLAQEVKLNSSQLRKLCQTSGTL